jgi:hypothetical protein
MMGLRGQDHLLKSTRLWEAVFQGRIDDIDNTYFNIKSILDHFPRHGYLRETITDRRVVTPLLRYVHLPLLEYIPGLLMANAEFVFVYVQPSKGSSRFYSAKGG